MDDSESAGLEDRLSTSQNHEHGGKPKKKYRIQSKARFNCSIARRFPGKRQQNMSLNSTMVKQTLKSNNRALARALQAVKQEYAVLLQQHVELKSNHQSVVSENHHLRSISSIKNDEIDREVDKRLKKRMGEIQDIVKHHAAVMRTSLDKLSQVELLCNCEGDLRSAWEDSAVWTIPSRHSSVDRRSLAGSSLNDTSVSPTRSMVNTMHSELDQELGAMASRVVPAVNLSMILEQSCLLSAPLMFENDMVTADAILEEGELQEHENGFKGKRLSSNRSRRRVHKSPPPTTSPKRSLRSRSRSVSRRSEIFSLNQNVLDNVAMPDSLVNDKEDSVITKTPTASENRDPLYQEESLATSLLEERNLDAVTTVTSQNAERNNDPTKAALLNEIEAFLPRREIARTPPIKCPPPTENEEHPVDCEPDPVIGTEIPRFFAIERAIVKPRKPLKERNETSVQKGSVIKRNMEKEKVMEKVMKKSKKSNKNAASKIVGAVLPSDYIASSENKHGHDIDDKVNTLEITDTKEKTRKKALGAASLNNAEHGADPEDEAVPGSVDKDNAEAVTQSPTGNSSEFKRGDVVLDSPIRDPEPEVKKSRARRGTAVLETEDVEPELKKSRTRQGDVVLDSPIRDPEPEVKKSRTRRGAVVLETKDVEPELKKSQTRRGDVPVVQDFPIRDPEPEVKKSRTRRGTLVLEPEDVESDLKKSRIRHGTLALGSPVTEPDPPKAKQHRRSWTFDIETDDMDSEPALKVCTTKRGTLALHSPTEDPKSKQSLVTGKPCQRRGTFALQSPTRVPDVEPKKKSLSALGTPASDLPPRNSELEQKRGHRRRGTFSLKSASMDPDPEEKYKKNKLKSRVATLAVSKQEEKRHLRRGTFVLDLPPVDVDDETGGDPGLKKTTCKSLTPSTSERVAAEAKEMISQISLDAEAEDLLNQSSSFLVDGDVFSDEKETMAGNCAPDVLSDEKETIAGNCAPDVLSDEKETIAGNCAPDVLSDEKETIAGNCAPDVLSDEKETIAGNCAPDVLSDEKETMADNCTPSVDSDETICVEQDMEFTEVISYSIQQVSCSSETKESSSNSGQTVSHSASKLGQPPPPARKDKKKKVETPEKVVHKQQDILVTKRPRRQTQTIIPSEAYMSDASTDDSFEVFKKPKKPLERDRGKKPKKQDKNTDNDKLSDDKKPNESSKFQTLCERPGKIVFRAGRLAPQLHDQTRKGQASKASKVKSLLPKPERPRSKTARSKQRLMSLKSTMNEDLMKNGAETEKPKTVFDMSLNESVTVLPQMSYGDFRERHPTYQAEKEAGQAMPKDNEDSESPHGIMLVTGKGKRTKQRQRCKSVTYAHKLTEVHLRTPGGPTDNADPEDQSAECSALTAFASRTPPRQTKTAVPEIRVPETPDQEMEKLRKASLPVSIGPSPNVDTGRHKSHSLVDSLDTKKSNSPTPSSSPYANTERSVSETSSGIPVNRRSSLAVNRHHTIELQAVEPVEGRKRSRRGTQVNYREPSLNKKLRQGDAVAQTIYKGKEAEKLVKQEKANRTDRKRSFLATITNF